MSFQEAAQASGVRLRAIAYAVAGVAPYRSYLALTNYSRAGRPCTMRPGTFLPLFVQRHRTSALSYESKLMHHSGRHDNCAKPTRMSSGSLFESTVAPIGDKAQSSICVALLGMVAKISPRLSSFARLSVMGAPSTSQPGARSTQVVYQRERKSEYFARLKRLGESSSRKTSRHVGRERAVLTAIHAPVSGCRRPRRSLE
ncbi:hypothetical protein C8Q73DRAFT_438342 [Cubamyces lactineus]|nr:hypothetical protein C8Q73DRAFT_438342 [Cubamyces lactineus]